jgi:hypothetical protein
VDEGQAIYLTKFQRRRKKRKNSALQGLKILQNQFIFDFLISYFGETSPASKKKGWFSQLHIHASAMTVVVPG